jgi:hypothetical protein
MGLVKRVGGGECVGPKRERGGEVAVGACYVLCCTVLCVGGSQQGIPPPQKKHMRRNQNKTNARPPLPTETTTHTYTKQGLAVFGVKLPGF